MGTAFPFAKSLGTAFPTVPTQIKHCKINSKEKLSENVGYRGGGVVPVYYFCTG